MKLLKQMLVGAALVTATFSAQAAVYELGTLTVGENSFTYNVAKTAFDDTLNFSVGNSSTDFLISSLFASGKAGVKRDIAGLSMSLFNAGGLISTGLDFTALTSGDYFMKVSGTGVGSSGGTYGVDLTVSPVPEAETYSMMLLGLGLMGFIARRRRAD